MPQIKRSHPLLGTFVEISIQDYDLQEHLLHDLAEIAFGRIARVQSLVSFRDPNSELSRLNACGHLHPLAINIWTREVISEAIRLGKASEGVFDITAVALAAGWGFLPHIHQRPAEGERPINYRDIVLHHDGRVSFRRPLQLDLSSIARGYAVDKAAEILETAGVASATINAGGDIRFIGIRPKTLSLRDAASPSERTLTTPVTAPAVTTSAAYFANHRHHWRKVSHILHPKTRKPMRSNVSVSVFAQSCLRADALAKVVLLDEPSSWLSLLTREKATAVFVTAKGEVVSFPAAA